MTIHWILVKEFTFAEYDAGEAMPYLEGHLDQICKLIHGGEVSDSVAKKHIQRLVDDPEPHRNEQVFVFKGHPIVRIQTFKNSRGEPEFVNYMVRSVEDLQQLIPHNDKPSKQERDAFKTAKQRGDGRLVNAMKKIKRILH